MKDMFVALGRHRHRRQTPGNVPHMEAVFGGSPQNIGMQARASAACRRSPTTAAIIENSIVFTFTSVFPDNPQTVCEVMAQEVAHSYGLDHEMLASDPMTYLQLQRQAHVQGPDGVVRRVLEPRRAASVARRAAQNQNSVQLLNAAPRPGRSRRADAADHVAAGRRRRSPPGFAVDGDGDGQRRGHAGRRSRSTTDRRHR